VNRPGAALRGCALVCALVALTWSVGCSPARRAAEPPASPPPEPSATATPEPAPQPDVPVSLAELSIGLEPVARGFDQPLLVTHAGDGSGRLFVVEQSGRVFALRDGIPADKPFLDVSGRISTGGERGLLGMAFAPDYATTGVFYVNYTNRAGDTIVARFAADDPASDTPRLTGPKSVLKIKQPYSNHNGGCLAFEPGSKRLWVGVGDGGSGGDPHGNAQNPKALLGKMLVLDFGKGASPRSEIVQTGVRNPWRFSFDRKTHDLWIGDVGQNAWEEIDVVPLSEAKGVDWGWNLWEGSHPYPEGSSPSKSGHRFPIAEYGHDAGQSVTGGFVYRGRDYPALAGTYFYGDFGSGFIAGLRREVPDGTSLARPESRVLLPDSGLNPSSFGEDEAGELYVCDHSGGDILRVVSK